MTARAYEDDLDHLDDLFFGEGPTGDLPSAARDLNWGDHFLNGRESGAGPDVEKRNLEALRAQGYTRGELAEAFRALAARLEKGGD